MIEENRLKAQERKRKREEISRQEASAVAESEQNSKRRPPSEEEQATTLKTQRHDLGFSLAYGNDEEDVIDLNEEDLDEYMQDIDEIG